MSTFTPTAMHVPMTLLFACAALVSNAAHARELGADGAPAPPQTEELELDRQRYAVERDGARVLVTPVPLAARLVRDDRQPPPECALLDGALGPFAPTIAECRVNSGRAVCDDLVSLVDGLRNDLGFPGRSALEQGWRTDAELPIATLEPVREALAEALGVGPNDVWFASHARAFGLPGAVQIDVDPDGESWASRLLGLVSVDGAQLEFDPDVDGWWTRDQVLACGLASGDVRLRWSRSADVAHAAGLDSRDRPHAALTDGELEVVYRTLAAQHRPQTALARAYAVGVALGDALRALGVPAERLAPGAAYALERSYSDATLEALSPPPSDPGAAHDPSPRRRWPSLDWVGRTDPGRSSP